MYNPMNNYAYSLERRLTSILLPLVCKMDNLKHIPDYIRVYPTFNILNILNPFNFLQSHNINFVIIRYLTIHFAIMLTF